MTTDSTWAEFADLTADREPLPFFDTALVVTDGEQGNGRLVVDLGCGAGVETRGFLARGWRVFAMDAEPHAIEVLLERVHEEHRGRLETAVGSFTSTPLPQADLVYASLSLPFAAEDFLASVDAALTAVKPGGHFVGVFLGPNDTWAPDDDTKVVDRSDLGRLFSGFADVLIEEDEFDGSYSKGDKHWHWFVVSARRPA